MAIFVNQMKYFNKLDRINEYISGTRNFAWPKISFIEDEKVGVFPLYIAITGLDCDEVKFKITIVDDHNNEMNSANMTCKHDNKWSD